MEKPNCRNTEYGELAYGLFESLMKENQCDIASFVFVSSPDAIASRVPKSMIEDYAINLNQSDPKTADLFYEKLCPKLSSDIHALISNASPNQLAKLLSIAL